MQNPEQKHLSDAFGPRATRLCSGGFLLRLLLFLLLVTSATQTKNWVPQTSDEFRVHCHAAYTAIHICVYILVLKQMLISILMLTLFDINVVECQHNDIINKYTISHLEARRPGLMQADGPGLHWTTP